MQQIVEYLKKAEFISDFIQVFGPHITNITINSNFAMMIIHVHEDIKDTDDRSYYQPYIMNFLNQEDVCGEILIDNVVVFRRYLDDFIAKLEVKKLLDRDFVDVLDIKLSIAIPPEEIESMKEIPIVKAAINHAQDPEAAKILTDVQDAINAISNKEPKRRLSYMFDKEHVVYKSAFGFIQHAVFDSDTLYETMAAKGFQTAYRMPVVSSCALYVFHNERHTVRMIRNLKNNNLMVVICIKTEDEI